MKFSPMSSKMNGITIKLMHNYDACKIIKDNKLFKQRTTNYKILLLKNNKNKHYMLLIS